MSLPCLTHARCPRCGTAFHCGAAGPRPCDCAAVTLTPEVLADLRARYQGCLCPACLRDVSASVAALVDGPLPAVTPAP